MASEGLWTKIGVLLGVYIAYQLLKALYRVTLHPLAGFPGHKLAALSYKYEFYYDGIRDGSYTSEIARMHDRYGPIVRINPNELHCNDWAMVDQIYAGGGARRDKSKFFLRGFGPLSAGSIFATEDHHLHRNRRSALSSFFSKASISKLQPLIHDRAQRLCDKFLEEAGRDKPIDIAMAYSCFTTDVIIAYCFGQTQGFLDNHGFEKNLRAGLHAGCRMLPVTKQWPGILVVVDSLPDSIAGMVSKDVATFLDFTKVKLTGYVKSLKKAFDSGEKNPCLERESVFKAILNSNLPEEEKSTFRLGAEASGLIGAGTETTAWTLAVATYYLKSKPDILKRIEAELMTVVTNPKHLPEWSKLERLPYLGATITETIRLSYGVATRLARVAPDETLIYSGAFKDKPVQYAIPPSTPISMTSVIMHADERIFPNADEFNPDRWLAEDGTRRTDLERYLMSFSKGSRQCIGINLAYCELYIALSALILRVFPHLELYETNDDDVKCYRDMFIPMSKADSKFVRVLMKQNV